MEDKESIRKKVLRKIPYGLFVTTSVDGDRSASGTINWVTQVSFKPPVVAVAIKKDSRLHEVISSSRKFALCALGKTQKELAQQFFKGPALEKRKMAGHDVELGTTGCPILKNCSGAVECSVSQVVDVGGDHTLFVAGVVDAHLFSDEAPLSLLETGWFYGG